ncbi:MAG: B-type flagellar hook-associated protein 2 [Porticoccaceae bacterium UBA1117]|nr:MAG: B-type flagellar hook-associated protein 2 [Porticoccaceae bacterium UBA1117]
MSAINAANTGVTATLIDTGTGANNFRIVLAGQTGTNGVFTLSSTPDLGFHETANTLQSAQDAIVGYEGLTLTRGTNALTDVIDGVTINLMGTSASEVRLTINNDRSILKTNIQDMVATYNDLLTLFNNFTATDSDADMAGALSEDGGLVRFLRDKLRAAVFADSSTSAGNITAMRDLGVSVNRYGAITFTEATYDTAVLSSYDDVVTMLTADTSNANLFATGNKGLAQDIVTALEDLTDATGIVTVREATAKTDKTEYEEELVDLEKRMDRIYNRYLTQFGAMEGLMATLDSTKNYLTSQLESISKAYDSD